MHRITAAIAELTLALLNWIGGLDPDTTLERTGHIPRASAPDEPSPGWVAGKSGLDLQYEAMVEAA